MQVVSGREGFSMAPQRSVFVALSVVVALSAGCASLVDDRRTGFDSRHPRPAPTVAGRTSTVAAAPVRQHIGTVASVDERSQTIRLTHGPIVRVAPSRVHDRNGSAVALRDLRPGDKLIFNVATEVPASSRRARVASSDAEAVGSALPRDAGTLATPGEVVDVMVFRPAR
jgi:hypothetical protein